MRRRKFLGTVTTAVGLSTVSLPRVGSDIEHHETTALGDHEQTIHDQTIPDTTRESLPSLDRFVVEGRQLDDLEAVSHWSGDVTPADGRSFTGSQSLKVQSSTGKAIAVGDFSDDPLDLEGEDISLAYYPDLPNAQPSVYLELFAPDRANRLQLKGTYDGHVSMDWHRLDIAPHRTFGDPDLSTVERVRFIIDDDSIRVWIDDLRAHPSPDSGKVILRFDDGSLRHYTDYFPLLSEYGYPAIAGVVINSVGNDSQMSIEQLQEMEASGWEILSHTMDHDAITDLSADELRADLSASTEWLTEHGFGSSTGYFITPYNNYDGDSLDVLDEHIDLAFTGGGPTNAALTSPLTVPAVNPEKEATQTLRAIDFAAEHRQLIVLMFHGINTDRLETICEHIQSKGDQLDVITASELHATLAQLHGL